MNKINKMNKINNNKMNNNYSRYQHDRFNYQKERFLQTFEAEQQSLIEYKQRLENERKLREQQDKEFKEALKRDQELEEIEEKSKKTQQDNKPFEQTKPLTKEELRLARLSFFTKVDAINQEPSKKQ